MKEHVIPFCKKNAVMLIAFLAASVTSFIVPPDLEYLGYFDFKTLTCLFCVLAVVCALKNIRFFYMLAHKIVGLFKNARASVLALIYVTFIGSMLIANDMALLTFLPLGFLVLSTTGKEKYMAFTFVMQNVAANLGIVPDDRVAAENRRAGVDHHVVLHVRMALDALYERTCDRILVERECA